VRFRKVILPMSIALSFLCLVSSPAIADLTPDRQKAVEALLKDFSSKEFAIRQKAVEKLIATGSDVIPLVKKALARTPDAEVKLRCSMVLKALVQAADA